MNSTICNAIRNKQVLEFYYDGGSRLVEPFCHGVSTAGNEVLRGFQTGGYSKSGNSHTWKMFRVDEISSISIKNEKFTGNRPHYNPNDKGMTKIHCNV
jgi:predicted DNA-binding transcriptional regulator YafY